MRVRRARAERSRRRNEPSAAGRSLARRDLAAAATGRLLRKRAPWAWLELESSGPCGAPHGECTHLASRPPPRVLGGWTTTCTCPRRVARVQVLSPSPVPLLERSRLSAAASGRPARPAPLPRPNTSSGGRLAMLQAVQQAARRPVLLRRLARGERHARLLRPTGEASPLSRALPPSLPHRRRAVGELLRRPREALADDDGELPRLRVGRVSAELGLAGSARGRAGSPCRAARTTGGTRACRSTGRGRRRGRTQV